MLKPLIENRLDKQAAAFLADPRLPSVDFEVPSGEPALIDAHSVSWRVFKNPVTLYLGGVAAVLLELSEPRVRTGVWEHSNFRTDPVLRLKRTGLAAMVTVYGARSVAQAMIARVNEMHTNVGGTTPEGLTYSAADPQLLDWVQATAAFGFVEAYAAFATPLSRGERDQFYREGQTAARLYGATGAPDCVDAQEALFEKMRPHLQSSPVIEEFLTIMRKAPTLPGALRLIQPMLIRAAISLVPATIRKAIGLDGGVWLFPHEDRLVRMLAQWSNVSVLRSSPAVQACRRLHLADDFLYRKTRLRASSNADRKEQE